MDGLSALAAAAEPGVADRLALIVPGAALRYGELAALVEACCARLTRAGVVPGARVAILSPNRLGAVVAIHALLSLGAVLVPIHPRLTAVEAAALLDDACPELVLREPDLAALEADLAEIVRRSPSGGGLLAPPPEAGDLAILYTSGTTGRAKGAVLPRRAFIASAAASAGNLELREGDRWLLCLPLCHVGGLSILTRCLLARCAVILAPRFDPEAVLASIARDGATLLSVVPTMLVALLEADRDNLLARLRAILVGGAAAPERALVECARRGVPALTTYGLTEACSQVTSQPPRDPRTTEAGSGRALPGIEVRIAGVGEDDAGRIQIRSPALFRGYWRGPAQPVDPARGVSEDGWLDTGDIGRLDAEGRLHVLARRTDLIVSGGENVYPAEVERALEACAGVARALVFGLPDERWGQIVAAALVLSPGAPAADRLAALAAELPARLASHKRPRRIAVIEELPVTAAGKLDRAGAAQRLAGLVQQLP